MTVAAYKPVTHNHGRTIFYDLLGTFDSLDAALDWYTGKGRTELLEIGAGGVARIVEHELPADARYGYNLLPPIVASVFADGGIDYAPRFGA